MLTPEHFKMTEIYFYNNYTGIYDVNSSDAMALLEHEHINGINYIGIFNRNKFLGFPSPEPAVPNIAIDFYHMDNINTDKSRHHSGSFRYDRADENNWRHCTAICQHSIRIQYPEIKLIKSIHDMGNPETRKGMRDFIKTADYFDIKRMETDEATWFMATVLGNSEND